MRKKEKKKIKTNPVSLDIFSPPSSPLHCGIFIYKAHPTFFGVKEFWRVLLDLYCLVKCSYNHSPMWSALSLSSLLLIFSLFYWRPGSLGHPVLCTSNSRNSLLSVPTIAEEAASSMFLFLVWVFVFVSCTRWTFSIQCSSNKKIRFWETSCLCRRFLSCLVMTTVI